MSATVTVPAGVVPAVRDGLYLLIGDACEELNRTLAHPDRELYPEWFQGDRKQLEHTFVLLDRVGWAMDSEPHDTEIDPVEYGRTLMMACERASRMLGYELQEADATDEWRSERGLPPKKTEIIRLAAAVREFIPVLGQHVAQTD